MSTITKQDIETPMGGLLLMTIMTGIWTALAATYLIHTPYIIICLLLFIELAFFVYTYYTFNKSGTRLPENQVSKPAGESKWFMIIFAAEGIAIFLAKNILVNTGHDEFFIPVLALIVGLHFFPLAKVFKRTFDYYVGAWTTAVAIAGIIITVQGGAAPFATGAFVSLGCAVATSCYGIKMCLDGRRILSQHESSSI